MNKAKFFDTTYKIQKNIIDNLIIEFSEPRKNKKSTKKDYLDDNESANNKK